MTLSRDSLRNDSFKQKMLDEAPGEMSLMDENAFEASRRFILQKAAQTGELWVFAYGSLIWNPIIEVKDKRPARLHGYGRRFCVWAPIGRGTPECPGLWLGLDAVERDNPPCEGIILRIDAEQWDEETLILWRREMISGVYIPEWLPVETEGSVKQCCVFVANPGHDRYAARISWDRQVEAISRASGSLGTCRSYLESLAVHLQEAGMSDVYIERLARDVAAVKSP